MDCLCEFVFNHKEACLSIDSLCICASLFVFGCHACKGKVDAQSLTWDTGLKGMLTWWNFLELSLNTSSALIQDRAQWFAFELRDLIATFVSMGCDCRREVTQSLLPQFPFCFGLQGMGRCLLADDFMVRVVSI